MRSRAPILLAVLALTLTACNSDPVELSTTSSVVTPTSGPDMSTTSTSTTQPQSSSTTLRGEIVTEYELVVRMADDNGEVLHVVIPPGAYTDVDLENFILDLRDSVPGLWGVEVFDDPAAATAFLVAETSRSEEEKTLIQDHHLVSLVNGDTIRFQGPLADFGEYVLAS